MPLESREAIEKAHVKGKCSDIAEKISGIRSDYLNNQADFGPSGKMTLEKAPFSVIQTGHDVIENEQLRTMDEAFD